MESTSYQGNIPFHYDEYLGSLLFEPFAKDMAHRIGELQPDHLLELSCGTGRLTRHLLEVLASYSKLQATDINPDMISLAKQKVGEDPRLTWSIANAMTLPFEYNSFDAIVGQFGVMFYPDKAASFAEACRVLKPGGTYLFSAWNRMETNPIILEIKDLLTEYLGSEAPTFYNIPFSYWDEETIVADLRKGGFSRVSIDIVGLSGYSSTAERAAIGLLKGAPVRTGIEEKTAALCRS